jgi:EpsI family protein
MRALNAKFVTAVCLLTFAAIALEGRSRTEIFPPRQPLENLPRQFGSWTSQDIPIDQQILEKLGNGEFLLRDYSNEDQEPSITLFIAYFRSQRTGETPHSPSHCLPGSGWVPSQRKIVNIVRPDGRQFPANRYVISKSGERALVLYWFLAHDRAVASEYSAKYYLIKDALQMNRSDGALVRLITRMYERETPDEAEKRLLGFNSQILPVMNNYIPR